MQYVGNGAVLYDASPYREHCRVILQNSWSLQAFMEEIQDTIYDNLNWQSHKTASLKISQYGLDLPVPLRVSPLDEGITIEFAYRFYPYSTPSYELLLFKSLDPNSVSSIKLDSASPSKLEYLKNGVASIFEFGTQLNLMKWYHYSVSFYPPTKLLPLKYQMIKVLTSIQLLQ
ncbi:UNKNOWN [Stylonychia lemnae]|uniref:Uncharacterized protein n=1 Tax=Stylonychia lemnae TaxID=5949 RepID=A0A078AFT1_STYLE|nr:UNKNOWN [Stylonychia lemnae]|eukprot:CDW80696.1 UNKNOWN [Stylonychia lemnae]